MPSLPSSLSPLRARTVAAVAAPGVLVAGLLIAAPATAASTLSVCGSGCDYTTISAAVGAASAGDTIDVQGGTYAESVAVDKSLTIEGTPGTTVLPGPSYGDAAFRLQANDVTIRGFVIGDRNTIKPIIGIDVGSTSGAQILDDIIVNNQRGVSLANASDVTVSGTRFSDNNGSGPDNNAALWGDGVSGITIEDSTFTGHTNTAINLAGSSDITISGSRFDDNGNVAVIWDDSDVTVSDNTGTLMGGSGVYLNHSSHVTISGNDLAAAAGASGVSVNNVDGPNSGVQVTDNVFRSFVRGIGVAGDAMDDALVASGNQFLTTTTGVRNQGSVAVDARGNWWGDATGPSDPTSADGSTPATNAGAGVVAEGPVDYRDWCVRADCTIPTPPPSRATSTIAATSTQRAHTTRVVLKIQVSAGTTPVTGGNVSIRKQGGKRVAMVAVHRGGKARAVLGRLTPGKHVYTLVYKQTPTLTRSTTQIIVKVR